MALPRFNYVVFVNDPHFSRPIRRGFWDLEKAVDFMIECTNKRYAVVEIDEI